jgi:L-fuconolactonase
MRPGAPCYKKRLAAMPIDTHQHYWRYTRADYGWIDDAMSAIQRDFMPDDVWPEMRAAGFDASVAVQVRQTLDETAWMLGLAHQHPFIAGVVGWVDLRSPTAGDDLDRVCADPALVGIRHIVQAEPDGFVDDPAFNRGIAALTLRDLPYDILVYARQLRQADAFVARHPHQRFLLDHLGKPDIRGGGFDAWRGDFDRLAARPNVWCKLSGLVTEADWRRWTPGQLRPYLDHALEAFGPSRLMVGSDWPVCTVAAGYGETMALVREALAEYSADERTQVLDNTARRFWNLREKPL